MIIDTFIFFNEIELLDIRLNILNDNVDRFVLVEATKTFQGKPKPLYFEESKHSFAKFKDKIIHVVVDDLPINAAPFDREHFQRDAILRGLDGCDNEDLIIISDLDEIPNPEVIPKYLEKGQLGLFRQKLFYYTLNTKCVELENLPWSLIVNFDEIVSPADLRKRVVAYQSAMLSKDKLDSSFKIIEDGGWHFSYLGSPEKIVTKIEAFSHDELDVDEFKNIHNIQSSIANGRDIFGRNLTFISAKMDELPRLVAHNISKYKSKGLLDLSLIDNSAYTDRDRFMPSSIIFDQFSRYKACSDLIRRARFVSGETVLDIGSGPECLFGQFIPEGKITYLDPLIEDGQVVRKIKGDVFVKELDGKCFDYVTAVDVLEHVPPDCRQAFIERLSSLGQKALILGFPASDSTDAAIVDRALEEKYRNIFKKNYSWLEEHNEYGLPSLASTVEKLQKLGWHCQTVGHGHAPWLKEFLGFVICIWEIPTLRKIVLDVSERFNRCLYAYDFRAPYYRQFIVASRIPLSKIKIERCNEVEGDVIFKTLIEDAKRLYFSKSLEQLVDENLNLDVASEERDAALVQRDAALAQRDSALQLVNLMIQSASWRLTRPLRFAARLIRYGFTNEDRQRITQLQHYYYHHLPLPSPTKKMLRFAYHRVFLKVVHLLRRSLFRSAPFQIPSIRPASQTKGSPDYIVFGVIDWHFRHQRPQQLALTLALTGRRIFYVSPTLLDDERAGFEVEALDTAGQMFQIKLFAKGAPLIYLDAPTLEIVAQLRRSVGKVLDWADSGQLVSLVNHPFWLDIASVLPNSRLVYDCMDHHEGFGNNAEPLLQLEKRLLVEAQLTITTSTWLYEVIAPYTKYRALIRNASDYEHFAKVPDSIYRDPQGRQIIGYYGAIAEWFDLDLIEAVAKQHPDCCVLLIGSDTVNAKSRLAKLNNVTLTGEVCYDQLPRYLHSFAVCLLPFKIIPLTLATNPVKAYEYLSAGKPVVAVDLPEMAQFDGLMYRAADNDAFLAAVRYVLSQREPDSLLQNRKIFAQGQTWQHRTETLIQHVESTARDPRISIVVVTYNNLELTRACLASLDEHSQYECMEIIVVDNASIDSSPTFLSEWAAGANNRKLILNDKNRGFAAANNQGLASASGDYLVLLNNDTYVTPGWVRTLMRHLERDRTIGLIGPVTNNIGNEAKIDITYEGMDEMLVQSASYTRRHVGQTYPIRTVAFFCVMMPRTTYERVGTLDEAFGRGFFEDDDYCRRVEQLGLRIVCAEDVFIHHHLSASFSKLKRQDRRKLFEENKIIYEAKWGEWIPHGYRKNHQSEVNE